MSPERTAEAIAPTQAEWNNIANTVATTESPQIDVVIPVYQGFAETLRCIFSVLRSAPENVPFRVLVVNDHSPDASLVAELGRLAKAGTIDLLNNEANIGFVQSVNRGLNDSKSRDVVILNSDTEVFHDWLNRLRRAAYKYENVACVTPFSNNAEICNYPNIGLGFSGVFEVPDSTVDAFAARVNAQETVEIPTGVGFCMFMRRTALRLVGLFDEERFGRGYGEENDWCRRAAHAGLINLLACDVFVRHYGGVSFGKEKALRVEMAMQTIASTYPDYVSLVQQFIATDESRPFRLRIDRERFRHLAKTGKTILILSHALGGGTEQHIADMSARLRREGNVVIIGKPSSENSNWLSLDCDQVARTEALRPIVIDREFDKFVGAIQHAGVDFIHVHHLLGFPFETSDLIVDTCRSLGIPYFVTIHDYFFICPRITLVNSAGRYCGEPDLAACESCILTEGSRVGRPSVWAWRSRHGRFLRNAACVFAPDRDVSARMVRHLPGLSVAVRPHEEPSRSAGRPSSRRTSGETRTVLIIGAISTEKGSGLIEEVARYAGSRALALRFVVMGITDRPLSMAALPNVVVTGPYEESDAVTIATSFGADLAWFPAVLPETYSFTLGIAAAAGLLPVAFDIGAIANRIRTSGFGLVLPYEAAYDAALVAETLAGIPNELLAQPTPQYSQNPRYKNLIADYYHLAPASVQVP